MTYLAFESKLRSVASMHAQETGLRSGMRFSVFCAVIKFGTVTIQAGGYNITYKSRKILNDIINTPHWLKL